VEFDAYRRQAEAFVAELGLEHYRHFAGLKPTLEIERIYDAHAGLFTREALEQLRAVESPALLEFCVEGLIGRANTHEAAELAEREASLELDLGDRRIPFRRSPIEQGNEADPDRRAAIEAARLETIERELDPLYLCLLTRTHELAESLGWPSTTAMCCEISGIDLPALERRTEALLDATEEEYAQSVEPRMRAELGMECVRRSDLPAFFRAASLDSHFPEELLLRSLRGTLSELGLDAGERVRIDADSRPTKSARAFCAAVRVPEEVYLVISPHGGRDDYETLLHEAGHAQHYAHVEPGLEFERRHLGDNSVTEAYAFLMQRLAADPAWLTRHLEVEGPGEIAEHARAAKVVFLRRYAAKLSFELELHDAPHDLSGLRASYARHLSRALRLDWPEETWLSDLDPFFYSARYLRAWALEAELARGLADDFGPAWFGEPEAGDRLTALWAGGQPARAGDLLGSEPEFAALTAELMAG
jgi:hypothetical protein